MTKKIIISLFLLFTLNLGAQNQKMDPQYTYEIVNRETGKHLYPAKRDEDMKAIYVDSSVPTVDPQTLNWLLAPAGEQNFWIVNSVSGLGIVPETYGAAPSIYKPSVFLRSLSVAHNPDSAHKELDFASSGLWKLVKTENNYYYIINKVTNYRLVADTDSDHVWQLPTNYPKPISKNRFQWEIRRSKRLNVSVGLEKGKGKNSIRIQKAKDLDTEPNDETKPAVVIGEVLIPFFLINDSTDPNPSSRVQTCPYYKLRREGYYKLQHSDKYAGRKDHEFTYTKRTGITTNSSTKVEKTTGWTVTTSASGSGGFLLDGLTGKGNVNISTKFNKELKLTATDDTTKMEWEEEEVISKVPEGREVRINVWSLADRYTLRRCATGNQKILEFVIINNKHVIEDQFPK